MRRRPRGDSGSTVVKVLLIVAAAFVVVVVGLVAVAVPVYLNYTRSANDRSAQTDLRRAISVLETCNSDTGRYPVTDAHWTATTPVCETSGNGQAITVTDGTTLTYRATGARAGTSYLLFASSSRGKHTSYCYSSARGGSTQTQTVVTTTACP